MRLLRTISIISTAIVSVCCASCGVDESTLTKIAVTKEPDKIVYNIGEKFDPTGMEVTGYYAEDKTALIKDYTYTPSGTLTTAGSKTITISYKTFKCTTKVTVTSSPIPPGPSPEHYYDKCEGLEGSALADKLQEINTPKSKSYDWSRYEAADESPTDPNSIISLYTRHNIPKKNHCGNYSWDKWNREHIFVQANYSQSTTDNHNIFACEGDINNIRNNHKFGEVSHSSGNRCEASGHMTDCYLDNKKDLFEPCDEAKGEVARSIMYGTVQYNYTMTGMMAFEIALKWHLEHPITTRDINRNEVVYKLQGNRNPFVDHPEYACKIWGTKSSATRQLCGLS